MQILLQKAWSEQRQMKGQSRHVPTWHLRSRMAFIMDNLQYCLQLDVLEHNYQQLQLAITKSQSFEEIEQAHETFVECLMRQCFMQTPSIARCLYQLFDQCQSFCHRISVDGYHSIGTQELQERTAVRTIS